MRLVRQSVSIKTQDPGINGVYKQIEWAGRHCYRSLDKISNGSGVEFVNRIIKLGHLSVLEHGTVYLKIPYEVAWNSFEDDWVLDKYSTNPYTFVKGDGSIYYITTNYRVLVENDWLDDLKYLCDEPTEYHERRVSVEFICSRGVWNEFIRHRVLSRTDDCSIDYDAERKFSFSQESTRYCNYSKDKFGNELTFIIPCWSNIESVDYSHADGSQNKWFNLTEAEKVFVNSLRDAQRYYLQLVIDKGWTPQQAREVLPNALRTELVMTGFISDWKQFIKLRSDNSAHPQAKELSDMLTVELNKYKLL